MTLLLFPKSIAPSDYFCNLPEQVQLADDIEKREAPTFQWGAHKDNKSSGGRRRSEGAATRNQQLDTSLSVSAVANVNNSAEAEGRTDGAERGEGKGREGLRPPYFHAERASRGRRHAAAAAA